MFPALKQFIGLSFAISVITKPFVFFGRLLSSISFCFTDLTLIFNDSIAVSFVSFDFFTLKSSEVSSLPNLIFFDISLPFLQTLTSTVFPTSVCATIFGYSFISFIKTPLNSKIISPALIPALSDGLPSATLATSAPLGLSNFSTSAISFLTTCILTPSHPLFVSPNYIN